MITHCVPMDLTEHQRQTLAEFKTSTSVLTIPEHLQDDCELVKWLIARKFNIDKAVAMLTKSLEWRKKWCVDTIADWQPPEVLRKYYPAGLSGFNKDGQPVWVSASGKVDMRGILRSVSKKDFFRYNIQILEKGCRVIQQQTKSTRTHPIFRQSLIIDLEDYSLDHATWKPGIDVTRELTAMHEANYPELLRTCYIINAPKVFTLLFTALKPLLDEATLKKAQIFGNAGWKEALLDDIPAEQLPVHYGGLLADPDGNPKCLEKICYGGTVPDEYYKKRIKGEELPNGYETAHISNRDKKSVPIVIEEPGSILSWSIETDNFDIGFAVTRLVDDETIEIIPEQRINSQMIPEEDSVVLQPGNYMIVMNNEFSLFRSKTVHYKLTIQTNSKKIGQ